MNVRWARGVAGLVLGHAVACGGSVGTSATADGGAKGTPDDAGGATGLTEVDAAAESAAGDDAGPGGLVPGVACNTLVNTAAPVPRTSVAGSAPTAAGGAVVAGHYEVTAAVSYVGDAGTNPLTAGGLLQQTVTLTATGAANTFDFETVEVVSYADGGPPSTELRGSASVVFNPAAKTMSLQGTCGRGSEAATYTVDTGDGGVAQLHELLGGGAGPVTDYVLTLR